MAEEYIKRTAAERAAHMAFVNRGDALQYSVMIKQLARIPPADVVPGSDFRDCRNELCLYCGKYKERHNGACDGCRWRPE